MSNGDGDPEQSAAETGDEIDGDGETCPPSVVAKRLDGVADDVETAETDSALDEIEATLDPIETSADTTDEDVTDRTDSLRDDGEPERGPYAEAVVEKLADHRKTVTTTEWTEQGLSDVVAAVERFVTRADEILETSLCVDTANSETVATGLSDVSDAVETAGLHPDEDAATIAALLEEAEMLSTALDDAQVFEDLTVREQLRREGFYDVLTPRNRRDFPPEWNAIRLYEARGEVEPILLALDLLDSAFMQENALDALEHLAPEAAYEAVEALARRRDTQPVRVLGRIGDERACETLHEFLGGRDTDLEETTLWALGCIGSRRSTEPVAQRLAADDPGVRSAAARALGLIGDTRAIDPLADRLDADSAERVRASAAWALNQIGTGRALETVAGYTDDRSYLVQAEAEKATGV